MAITARTIQNKRSASGEFTGASGTVYDVNVKYRRNGKQQTYSKKGFLTKKEATQHEAEMRQKLGAASFTPPSAAQQKTTVEEYLAEWIENHGTSNLRPSTFASYKSHLRNHIFPYIGYTPLKQLTPAILDDLYRQLSETGLSPSSVKYAHRIISVAMEHARKYHYIETNPARDIITKFGKQGKTPPPYTIEQMRMLLSKVAGTPWEMIIVLGGLYGLRLGDAYVKHGLKIFLFIQDLLFWLCKKHRHTSVKIGQTPSFKLFF